MKILYYTWNEIIKTDVIQTFIKWDMKSVPLNMS